jgi:hypothetical protein
VICELNSKLLWLVNWTELLWFVNWILTCDYCCDLICELNSKVLNCELNSGIWTSKVLNFVGRACRAEWAGMTRIKVHHMSCLGRAFNMWANMVRPTVLSWSCRALLSHTTTTVTDRALIYMTSCHTPGRTHDALVKHYQSCVVSHCSLIDAKLDHL